MVTWNLGKFSSDIKGQSIMEIKLHTWRNFIKLYSLLVQHTELHLQYVFIHAFSRYRKLHRFKKVFRLTYYTTFDFDVGFATTFQYSLTGNDTWFVSYKSTSLKNASCVSMINACNQNSIHALPALWWNFLIWISCVHWIKTWFMFCQPTSEANTTVNNSAEADNLCFIFSLHVPK